MYPRTMFGLGWMELLIIGGALMLIAGPAAAPKLLAGFDAIRRARGLDKLSKANAALEALSGAEEHGADGDEPSEDDVDG